MGSWGAGLYSDDTACDVRDDYKDLLGDGLSEPEATKRLIGQWYSEIDDQDVGPVFWLALADTQWNLGRLQESVKQNALDVIETGSDLARWTSNKKHEKQRKAILECLKIKLESEQPVEKKVKKRFVDSTDWKIGEVYSLKLKTGQLVLLHVIGFHQDKGGRAPVCEVFEWTGVKPPDRKTIKKLGFKFAKPPHQHLSQFLFGSLSVNDFKKERVQLVAEKIKPKQKCGGYSVIFWRSVDQQFEKFFGYSNQ